jgi:hypothetical protein
MDTAFISDVFIESPFTEFNSVVNKRSMLNTSVLHVKSMYM